MTFLERMKTKPGISRQAPLTPLLEAHFVLVSGGRCAGGSHVSTGCGDTHDSRTNCPKK